jgi:hypothetical protein
VAQDPTTTPVTLIAWKPSGAKDMSDDHKQQPGSSIDWRGWIALGWALWFGWLYLLMVIHERAPALARALPAWIQA